MDEPDQRRADAEPSGIGEPLNGPALGEVVAAPGDRPRAR